MDDRTELTKKLVALAEENGRLMAQIDALHRIVDHSETVKSENIIGGDIDPKLIRSVFGWSMCDSAKNALIEREAWFAAKKKEMQDAGIQLL